MAAATADSIRFCKEFLSQLSKLSVEYLEGYVEKKRKGKSVALPRASSAPSHPGPAPPSAAPKDKETGRPVAVVLKRLGGAAPGIDVALGAGATVQELRSEAAKHFGPTFTLMYKGRPMTEGRVADLVTDAATPIYVNVKSAGSGAPALPDAFWPEFKALLDKHTTAPHAEKLLAKFKSGHAAWI